MPRSQVTDLLMLIYDYGPISRTEVVKEMHLSPSYVSTVVRESKERELLVVRGRSESKAGRRRVLLEINPDLGHFIGVDIGSVYTRFVVTDLLGNVLVAESCRTGQSQSSVLPETDKRIAALLAGDSRIQGIGVGEAGQVDADRGVVFFPRLNGWTETPLQKVLEERFGLPVLVDDSARTAAIAEQRFGEGRGVRDAFYVALGMGIGAAIFVDGSLYRGRSGLAGEVGHITISEEGALCYCGNRGCLEMYASGKAIFDTVRSGLAQGVASTLSSVAAGELSYEAITSAAESGDRLAYGALTQAGSHLGTALADIVNLLNPTKIILGGKLPQVAGRWLCEPLMRSLRERAFPQSLRALDVVVSSLGDETAARGAALMIGRELLHRRALAVRA